MRRTNQRRFTPDATKLARVKTAQRAARVAREKAEVAEQSFAAALLDAAEAGYTMRELARVCGITLSTVYRRITEAEASAA